MEEKYVGQFTLSEQRVGLRHQQLPLGQLQLATGATDGIDIRHDTVGRVLPPERHRIPALHRKHRLRGKDHLLAVPFLHQTGQALLGKMGLQTEGTGINSSAYLYTQLIRTCRHTGKLNRLLAQMQKFQPDAIF